MSESPAEAALAQDEDVVGGAASPSDPVARADGPSPSSEPVRGAASAFTDIASISAARAVSILLSLASVTLVTHLLSPRQYSILAYIGVMSSLMFTATSSWTSTAVTRYGREELEKFGSIRGTSWARLTLAAPLVVLAIALISVLKLSGAVPHELSWTFVLIAIATGLGLIAADHALSLLEASGRMKLTAVSLVAQRVVSVVAIGALAAWGAARSSEAIALVWMVAGGMLAAGLVMIVWKVGIWPIQLDRTYLRRMVRFSLPMVAFAVSQYVIGAIDIVILGAYRPARDVGLYAVAYQGYGVLQTLATTATIVLSPLFVSIAVASRSHVIERFFVRLVPQALLLVSILAGLAAPLLGVVVPLVFGRAFSAASTPLALLLLAWILYSAASFVAPIVVLHERSREIAIINTIAALVNVIGDWVLVGGLGAGTWAPAVATDASLTVIAVGYFYAAARCVDATARGCVAMMAPAAGGVACALVLHGAVAVVVGLLTTLVITAVVLVVSRPIQSQDAELIEKLNIPGPGRRWALAVVKWFG